MLQGNPFETKMTVDERTKTVRHEVQQQRLPHGVHSRRKLQRPRWPTMSSLDVWSLSARAVQVAKSSWWVPAGIAILILLNAILAG